MNKTIKSKPFLRWAGGKNWLAKSIEDFLPYSINNYYEPFLGGGSIFIALKQKGIIQNSSYLADINPLLINSYKIIKKHPNELIKELKKYRNTKDFYYHSRNRKMSNQIESAAQFIFLNRTSFNGIYRENLKGEYNVPYGYKSYKELFDYDNILRLSKLYKKCYFSVSDFHKIKRKVKQDDLVFLDPPYTVAHSNNGFVKYNQKIFSWDDQEKLRDLVLYFHNNDIKYILTNAYHLSIKELYSSFASMEVLERKSLVGGINAKRQTYKEFLITNIIKNGK